LTARIAVAALDRERQIGGPIVTTNAAQAVGPRAALFDVDEALARETASSVPRGHGQAITVPVIELARGVWRPPFGNEADLFGLLVVTGALVQRVPLGERVGAEILGPGDVVRPWGEEMDLVGTPLEAQWEALVPARLALLDERFMLATAGFPAVLRALGGRCIDRAHRLRALGMVAHFVRVEDRVLLALWHLADRWGTVHPDGVHIGLRLSHELIAELVGARRPTVSAALKDLRERGVVSRGPGRTWILSHGSAEKITPAAAVDAIA
jgi:CRP/FNR family transcriptional regulator, cyclic AMP receptor protein